MTQFRTFIAAAEKMERMRAATLLQNVAIGAQGDSKSITEVLDKLLNGDG